MTERSSEDTGEMKILPELQEELPPHTVERYEGAFWRAGSATAASEKHPEENQDVVRVDAKERLFSLCDGMGGYKGGKEAAETVADIIHDVLASAEDDLDDSELVDLLPASMKTAFGHANDKLLELRGEQGMETTGTAVQLWQTSSGDTVASIGHVGDCRVYLVEPTGHVQQVTQDHDFFDSEDGLMPAFGARKNAAGDFVKRDIKTGAEEVLSPERLRELMGSARRAVDAVRTKEDVNALDTASSMLYNYRNVTMGVGTPSVRVQTHLLRLSPGSRLAILSDGVYENFAPEKLAEMLSAKHPDTPDARAKALVYSAQWSGHLKTVLTAKKDDLSAIVIDIP